MDGTQAQVPPVVHQLLHGSPGKVGEGPTRPSAAAGPSWRAQQGEGRADPSAIPAALHAWGGRGGRVKKVRGAAADGLVWLLLLDPCFLSVYVQLLKGSSQGLSSS